MNSRHNTIFLIIVFILALFISLYPSFHREKYFSGNLISEDSYYYLRISQDNPLSEYDSISERSLNIEKGWPFLLSFNPQFLIKWLPIILSLLSLILLFKIVDNPLTASIAVGVFSLSPQFISIVSTSKPYSAILFLFLLLTFFLKKEKNLLSLILIPIIFFFSFIGGIMSSSYFLYKTKNKLFFSISLLLGLAVSYFNFPSLLGINLLNPFINSPKTISGFIKFILSDFGSANGLSLFTLLMAGIAIYSLYSRYLKYLLIYFLILLFLFLGSAYPIITILISIPISIAAAVSLIHVFSIRWESDLLKKLTLIIIFCGILFSGIAYQDRLLNSEPTTETMEAVKHLSALEKGIVLSTDEKSSLISFAGKIPFISHNYLFTNKIKEKIQIRNLIFNSKNFNEINSLLKENEIKYLFLDEKMRLDSLQLELDKNPLTEKVYNKLGVQIWRFEN